MKILNLFKKKPPKGREVEIVNTKDIEDPKMKKIAELNGIMLQKALMSQKKELLTAEGINKKFIKRTIGDIKTSEGKSATPSTYAMDGGDIDQYGKFAPQMSISPEIARFLAMVNGFLGWQLSALLCQNWLINKACYIHGVDALSSGYRFIGYDNDKFDVNFLQEMADDAQNVFSINDICIRASFICRMYGGAIIFPVVDGADYEKPFNIKDIKPNTYKGMRVVEPYWLSFDFENGDLDNPMNLHFYEPTYYRIGGIDAKKVHRSWVIHRNWRPVSDILKPTYYYYGISLPQMIYNRVYCFERIANEAPLLAMTKRLLVCNEDIEYLLANPGTVEKTLDLIVQCRDNFGVFIKDKNSTVSQIDTALTDFDTLIQKQGEIVAAISELRLDQVVKTSSKNSNSGGLFQENEYKAVLRREQVFGHLPILNFHNKLWLKSERGIKDGVKVIFNSFDTPTELEQAKTLETLAMYFAHLQSMGNISQEEVRTVLRTMPNSHLTWIKEENPDLINLEKEEEEAHENIEGNSARYKNTGISNAVK